jgi:hypothetical protein
MSCDALVTASIVQQSESARFAWVRYMGLSLLSYPHSVELEPYREVILREPWASAEQSATRLDHRRASTVRRSRKAYRRCSPGHVLHAT